MDKLIRDNPKRKVGKLIKPMGLYIYFYTTNILKSVPKQGRGDRW